MKTEIICLGKLKETYLKEASAEYEKRLGPYIKLTITELKEERLHGEGLSAEKKVIEVEGNRLLSAAEKINGKPYLIALDSKGKKYDSEGFAKIFMDQAQEGFDSIVFFIGGSLGLSDEVRKKARLVLSFSDLTFPHQLMRVILLEQIYRAQKINSGETYHK